MYELRYIEGAKRPYLILEPPARVIFKLARKDGDLAKEILFNLNEAGDETP